MGRRGKEKIFREFNIKLQVEKLVKAWGDILYNKRETD
jgi:hypothetical protein